MIAALAGYRAIVEFLLKQNANVDQQEWAQPVRLRRSLEGNTAAHFAASQNRRDILPLLMHYSASLCLTNLEKRTAIDYCTEPIAIYSILTGYRCDLSFSFQRPNLESKQPCESLHLHEAVPAAEAASPAFQNRNQRDAERGLRHGDLSRLSLLSAASRSNRRVLSSPPSDWCC